MLQGGAEVGASCNEGAALGVGCSPGQGVQLAPAQCKKALVQTLWSCSSAGMCSAAGHSGGTCTQIQPAAGWFGEGWKGVRMQLMLLSFH